MFMKSVIPGINAYVAMFIGAVFRHQDRIATEDEKAAISIKN